MSNKTIGFRAWQAFSGACLKMTGWSAVGSFARHPKCVVVSPHTSNWDAAFSVWAGFQLGVQPHWLGKEDLFWGIQGWIMRASGGIPVNRSNPQQIVHQMVEIYATHEQFALFITPEATRQHTTYWRTGFYHIAHQSNVPIVMGIIDYAKKQVGVGEYFIPTGDIHKDMERIAAFYQHVTPKYPHKMSPVRLKPEE